MSASIDAYFASPTFPGVSCSLNSVPKHAILATTPTPGGHIVASGGVRVGFGVVVISGRCVIVCLVL